MPNGDRSRGVGLFALLPPIVIRRADAGAIAAARRRADAARAGCPCYGFVVVPRMICLPPCPRRSKLPPLADRGPLRVMFVITSMPVGGAETLLVELVRRMDRAGSGRSSAA